MGTVKGKKKRKMSVIITGRRNVEFVVQDVFFLFFNVIDSSS